MSTTTETIETAINSVPELEIEVPSFGKEIAKTLAFSAATTAGMIAGALAIGYAANKYSDLKLKRADKKAAEKATLVDVSDKTPANENN